MGLTCFPYIPTYINGICIFIFHPYNKTKTLSVYNLCRVYPRAFAEKILALHASVLTQAAGKPQLKESDVRSAQELFEVHPWSTWDDAHLLPVIKYMRGNKHMRPSPSWQAVFPRSFEVLHRIDIRRKRECGEI